MITENDLLEAIAECQGERNPNANTCIKLAAYYTILDNVKPKKDVQEAVNPAYSYSADTSVHLDSETEFAQKIEGMYTDDVLKLMDELMTTLQVVNPRLYKSVMRRI